MKAKAQSDLFESPDLAGMVRRNDHSTSVEAAERVYRKRSALQRAVLACYVTAGPMTDAELESRPEFGSYRYSTVRKRRSELFQEGLIEETGSKRPAPGGGSSLKVWRVSNAGKREALRLGILRRIP